MPCYRHLEGCRAPDGFCIVGSKEACKPSEDHTKLKHFARLLHERRDILELAPGEKQLPEDSTMARQLQDKVQVLTLQAEKIVEALVKFDSCYGPLVVDKD
ncbi:MAG: hypothetical protein Q9183_006429 [Haloplaca sp. 2 TL-2023]